LRVKRQDRLSILTTRQDRLSILATNGLGALTHK